MLYLNIHGKYSRDHLKIMQDLTTLTINFCCIRVPEKQETIQRWSRFLCIHKKIRNFIPQFSEYLENYSVINKTLHTTMTNIYGYHNVHVSYCLSEIVHKMLFFFFSKFCFPVFIFKYTSLSLNIPPISTKGFICKVMFFILLKSWLSSLYCLISPWWFLQIMQEYFKFTFQFSSIDIYFHNDLEDIDAITNMWYNALTTTSFITCRLSKLECYFWCLHGVTVAHFNILIM